MERTNEVTIPAHLLPDPVKLEMLADVLDIQDRQNGSNNHEVQGDLRKWAAVLREYGVNPPKCSAGDCQEPAVPGYDGMCRSCWQLWTDDLNEN